MITKSFDYPFDDSHSPLIDEITYSGTNGAKKRDSSAISAPQQGEIYSCEECGMEVEVIAEGNADTCQTCLECCGYPMTLVWRESLYDWFETYDVDQDGSIIRDAQ